MAGRRAAQRVLIGRAQGEPPGEEWQGFPQRAPAPVVGLDCIEGAKAWPRSYSTSVLWARYSLLASALSEMPLLLPSSSQAAPSLASGLSGGRPTLPPHPRLAPRESIQGLRPIWDSSQNPGPALPAALLPFIDDAPCGLATAYWEKEPGIVAWLSGGRGQSLFAISHAGEVPRGADPAPCPDLRDDIVGRGGESPTSLNAPRRADRRPFSHLREGLAKTPLHSGCAATGGGANSRAAPLPKVIGASRCSGPCLDQGAVPLVPPWSPVASKRQRLAVMRR